MNSCLLNAPHEPGMGSGAAGDTEVMSLDDKHSVNLADVCSWLEILRFSHVLPNATNPLLCKDFDEHRPQLGTEGHLLGQVLDSFLSQSPQLRGLLFLFLYYPKPFLSGLIQRPPLPRYHLTDLDGWGTHLWAAMNLCLPTTVFVCFHVCFPNLHWNDRGGTYWTFQDWIDPLWAGGTALKWGVR